MSFTPIHSRRSLIAAITITLLLFLSFAFNIYSQEKTCNILPVSISLTTSSQPNLIDFNTQSSTEKILVLTPLKDAVVYLDRYFELLDRTTYPNQLISIAFLVSDSSDGTLEVLQSHARRLQSRWTHRFESIRIFQKDFDFDLPSDKRHRYEMQPLRRSIMARSRNWLLSASLRADVNWVAWVDVDVVEYPATIFEDLMRADVDVIVPNCLLKRPDNAFWAYDKNNWQETDRSREIQKGLDEEFVLLEGYYEFPTYRYLANMPTEVSPDYKVPLDGVGATFTFVKAHVHREGALFPAFTYQHQVETEGFAKMAKSMGFGVYGLPGYLIYHIQND
ncbi:hypothetical protein G6F37_006565 [Rhizopus arrhizus]|nr:hypothetical protein G6F38_006224 [Rhizopus arrhizus]KAG1157593.1 hypothetical protein G6F37_006565 [Rhizopus arrhizus]